MTATIEREVARWEADGVGYWMFRSRATGEASPAAASAARTSAAATRSRLDGR